MEKNISHMYHDPAGFVLAAGRGWLAVNKPVGMTVHNAPGNDVCSIALERIKKDGFLKEKVLPDMDFSIHPVHRLDKETSGVLVLAATPDVLSGLSGQFKSRDVRKHYIALLHGTLSLPEREAEWGVWQWPLSKSAAGRRNPKGTGKKFPSETRYRIITPTPRYTLVDIEILSGRTHQIRRHAKLAGHPVVGDRRYGSTRAIRFLEENHHFSRLALHAQSLTFQPSDKKKPVTIQTPGIPDDILQLIDSSCS